MLRRYVNDQSDHLKFDERSSINEFLALMITLTNYECSAHSRLRHLGDHISSGRDPMLANKRRNTASSTRRALRSADTSTQGQLERLDLYIESNAELQPHRDSLYLTDLKIAHSSLHHYTPGSLRDLLQSHFQRLEYAIQSEVQRRRPIPTVWHQQLSEFSAIYPTCEEPRLLTVYTEEPRRTCRHEANREGSCNNPCGLRATTRRTRRSVV